MQQFIVPITEMKAKVVANAIISVLKNQQLPIKTLTVDNAWEFTVKTIPDNYWAWI